MGKTRKAFRILVHCNGDQFTKAKSVLVASNVTDIDHLLEQITPAFHIGALRKMYTSTSGSRVTQLGQLMEGGRFVVARQEPFKKLSYAGIRGIREQEIVARSNTSTARNDMKLPGVMPKLKQGKAQTTKQVMSKVKDVLRRHTAKVIYIIRNGDAMNRIFKLVLDQRNSMNMDQIFQRLTCKVNMRTPVNKLFTLSGKRIDSFSDIESGATYVCVSTHAFKKMPYKPVPPIARLSTRRSLPPIAPGGKTFSKEGNRPPSPEQIEMQEHMSNYDVVLCVRLDSVTSDVSNLKIWCQFIGSKDGATDDQSETGIHSLEFHASSLTALESGHLFSDDTSAEIIDVQMYQLHHGTAHASFKAPIVGQLSFIRIGIAMPTREIDEELDSTDWFVDYATVTTTLEPEYSDPDEQTSFLIDQWVGPTALKSDNVIEAKPITDAEKVAWLDKSAALWPVDKEEEADNSSTRNPHFCDWEGQILELVQDGKQFKRVWKQIASSEDDHTTIKSMSVIIETIFPMFRALDEGETAERGSAGNHVVKMLCALLPWVVNHAQKTTKSVQRFTITTKIDKRDCKVLMLVYFYAMWVVEFMQIDAVGQESTIGDISMMVEDLQSGKIFDEDEVDPMIISNILKKHAVDGHILLHTFCLQYARLVCPDAFKKRRKKPEVANKSQTLAHERLDAIKQREPMAKSSGSRQTSTNVVPPSLTSESGVPMLFDIDAFVTLEKEFVAVAQDAGKTAALWDAMDINDNDLVSLAEIDRLVTLRYPLLNHDRALLRAYRQTTLKDGGDGDAWVEPHEFPQLLVNVFYYNKLFQCFSAVDTDHDHRLDFDEFWDGLAKMQMTLDPADARAVFDGMDSNDGGVVLFDEFCTWYTKLHEPTRKLADCSTEFAKSVATK